MENIIDEKTSIERMKDLHNKLINNRESFDVFLNKVVKAYNEKGLDIAGHLFTKRLYEDLRTEGLADKILTLDKAPDREIIKYDLPNSKGCCSPHDDQETPSVVKQNCIYPEEFTLTSMITWEHGKLDVNILKEKYKEAKEIFLYQEDIRVLQMLELASKENLYVVFENLNLKSYSLARKILTKCNKQVSNCIIPMEIFNDIGSNGAEFNAWFDPVTKRNLVMEGSLGKLMGINLITDNHRPSKLDPSIFYMTTNPENLGYLTERQVLCSNPINVGGIEEGWCITGIEALSLINLEGVVKGIKNIK